MNAVNNGIVMYAKHGTLVKLVNADASVPKPVQNTLNRVYFGITETPMRDYVLLYRPNNGGFRVGNIEGKV